MLLRNMQPDAGLCNGTRLVVDKLHDQFIEATMLTGSHQGDRIFIPRIDMCPSETNLPGKLRRRQFPILPAFAITINRSQGQTFEHVGIALTEPVFAHGQLYVALSRATHEENLHVAITPTEDQGCLDANRDSIYTLNIVYKELL